MGLVVSENRPGGNVTGILRYVDGLAGKDLGLAKKLVPSASRVGLLVNIASAENTSQRRDVETAGRQLNIVIVPAEVREPDDLDTALKNLAGANVQAVIVLQDSMFFSEHRRIAALTAVERLPTVWTASLFVDDGGLISYGVEKLIASATPPFLCKALVLWLGGGALYLWIIALIFFRYTFVHMAPEDLTPPPIGSIWARWRSPPWSEPR